MATTFFVTVGCAPPLDPTPEHPATSRRENPSPTSAPLDSPSAPPLAEGGERFDYGSDPAQFGWLRTPAETWPADQLPVVVLVHGGFWSEPWDYTLMTPLETSLIDAGYATWNIEFRRVGGRGGWPETFDDVSAAIDHLQTLATAAPLDVNCVLLVGHSSGGHLSLRALDRPAANVPIVAALGIGAITDLTLTGPAPSFLGGSREMVPDHWRDATLTFDPERTILIHGEGDTIVPIANLSNAKLASVPIVHIANEDHFDAIDPTSQTWQATLDVVFDKISSNCDRAPR